MCMKKPFDLLKKPISGLNTEQGHFRKNHDLFFYEFPNLAEFPQINHGIFTRISGFSSPPFSSLNVGLDIGDHTDNVQHNRTYIATCLETDNLVFAQQVHGIHVLTFKKKYKTGKDGPPLEGDAMITDIPGKMLAIKVADCQPVLLFDPDKKVVANIHSGWRGSIQNIISHTLKRMETDFNCNPSNIIAGVGPSLGPCCSEFIHYKKEIPEKFWKYKLDNDHFNFWAISHDQLVSNGVLSNNIHISRLCTSCNTNLFFSYRKEKTTGRFAAVIGLK